MIMSSDDISTDGGLVVTGVLLGGPASQHNMSNVIIEYHLKLCVIKFSKEVMAYVEIIRVC